MSNIRLKHPKTVIFLKKMSSNKANSPKMRFGGYGDQRGGANLRNDQFLPLEASKIWKNGQRFGQKLALFHDFAS